jgi:hypothetical protein
MSDQAKALAPDCRVTVWLPGDRFGSWYPEQGVFKEFDGSDLGLVRLGDGRVVAAPLFRIYPEV